MKTIWKFPIPIKDICNIQVPFLSEDNIRYLGFQEQFLCAQVQNGSLNIWALVDPERESRIVPLKIVGTGNACGYVRAQNYLDTVQIDGFVWHIFIA